MKHVRFALFLLLFLPLLSQAAQIKGVRMWSGPDGTRVVFDVNSKVNHHVFVLKSPDRVVIDLENTAFNRPLSSLDYSNSLVRGIRTGTHQQSNLRVVLDMKDKVIPKSFLLNPTRQYGYRLVVDLESTSQPKVIQPTVVESTGKLGRKSVPNLPLTQSAREVVVAIDAGHGGEDPGALGRRGTREKDVVLSIARKLEKLLRKEPGIRPVLIRSGDYYVSLRGRVRKAREHKADLFVSIHADAFRNERAQGASVFVLSQRGASSEAARWLAASENNADLIGGVSLDDKDDLLASVLLDLSQNATLAASMDVGERILGELKRVGNVHKDHVEHAGFVVLKSPDVPSILVETGFISNRHEENKLRSHRHQQQIANALLKGVKHYFHANPPAGTTLALRSNRQHLVSEGDTLSSIARQYRVTPRHLKSANGLRSDNIKVGHTLIIPLVGGS